MNKLLAGVIVIIFSAHNFCKPAHKEVAVKLQTTICNPLNLNYRFCLDDPSRREAADPAIVLFKGEYYLFASKSGGYWHSSNLIEWNLILTSDLPLEDYAPAAVSIGDTMYFMASGKSPVHIFKTSDPRSGRWQAANSSFSIGMTDPDLFLDNDGRLYFYYGCSDTNPIYGVELDPKSLDPVGSPVECFNSDVNNYGWERKGDYNNLSGRPWIEGAWMTRFKDKYYLQYAAPGTEFKSYCDGVYMSDKPLGPFTLAQSNPFSYKPEGFIAGAGHSSTFQDKYGNYWHVATMSISQKHVFERRLGLFPVFFDNDDEIYTYTGFGDFPMIIPQKKINSPEELFPGWMLLSYDKPVETSSVLTDHQGKYITDENIRTYWSAETGEKGEWITIDLQGHCLLNAVQVNFAEHQTKLHDRSAQIYFQYMLEASDDKNHWVPIADKTVNQTDVPHDYIELAVPVKARYVRLTNYHVPDGTFSLSGLRVFGNGQGEKPANEPEFTAMRNKNDRREVKLNWKKPPDVTGINIRYGTRAGKLYHVYQVLGADSVTIRSLNILSKYFISIDAFNENGILKSSRIATID
jgi:xylan 1,4-beta-xylosidase